MIEASRRRLRRRSEAPATGAVTTGFVTADGVHKSFGKLEVLRGVSFAVNKGDVVCLIGPSGSGKSTMLRCINRLETPSQGHIFVDGVDVTQRNVDLPRVRREIGMVFQSFNLFPHRTVIENVMEGPRIVLGLSRGKSLERGRQLLAQVGLSEKERDKPARLSGGQKQRVAIARALAMNPKLMLFDEPTSALDPELVNEVLTVMTDLAQKGMTMIVVTHEIHFAEKVANKVLMLDSGTIIEEGPPDRVLHNATHPRTRAFLSQLEH